MGVKPLRRKNLPKKYKKTKQKKPPINQWSDGVKDSLHFRVLFPLSFSV